MRDPKLFHIFPHVQKNEYVWPKKLFGGSNSETERFGQGLGLAHLFNRNVRKCTKMFINF